MVFPNHRGRRLRKHNSIRESLAETNLCVQNLVMPYFIDESNKISSIDSMEGIKRYTEESIVSEVGELLDLGVKMVALFPYAMYAMYYMLCIHIYIYACI